MECLTLYVISLRFMTFSQFAAKKEWKKMAYLLMADVSIEITADSNGRVKSTL